MEKIKIIMIAIMPLWLFFGASSLAAEQPWLTDFKAAQKLAQEKNRIVLAAFVGSDWCPWCQKLEAEVFNQPEFSDFSRDRLILFQADFPKHKELPAELKNQNRDLMNQYAIKKFPTVLLLGTEGNEIGRMSYLYGGAAPYLEALKAKIPQTLLTTERAPSTPAYPSFLNPFGP